MSNYVTEWWIRIVNKRRAPQLTVSVELEHVIFSLSNHSEVGLDKATKLLWEGYVKHLINGWENPRFYRLTL